MTEKERDEREDVITLHAQNGLSQDFQVVVLIEFEGNTYFLLEPLDQEPEEGEPDLLLLRREDDKLVGITDDAEFDRVVKFIEELEGDAPEA